MGGGKIVNVFSLESLLLYSSYMYIQCTCVAMSLYNVTLYLVMRVYCLCTCIKVNREGSHGTKRALKALYQHNSV